VILLLDNYDSFVWNLARYVRELGREPLVRRNDAITLEEIAALAPTHIIISPGPCTPSEAGISVATIRRFGSAVPVLGVCLGHQAIGAALGGNIVRAGAQMHGKTSLISTDQRGVYAALPAKFTVNRYHSLVIGRASLPAELEISATADDDGEIMGVRHRALAGTATPLEGVQFHPESIISEHGHALLKNFLEMRP